MIRFEIRNQWIFDNGKFICPIRVAFFASTYVLQKNTFVWLDSKKLAMVAMCQHFIRSLDLPLKNKRMGTKDEENDELNTMVDDCTSVMLENKITYH